MDEAFRTALREWVAAACVEWGWPTPGDAYFRRVNERLPAGLRALLARGLASGLIIPQGRTFMLRGLSEGKGPYAWFSRHIAKKGPNPNWEYFVQVGEFVRLTQVAAASRLTVTFEDHLMDLALYQGERLLVCVEVKERESQLQNLIRQLKMYEPGVDLAAPDRGNDGLRKAKYLVRRRPEYFCGVALGIRLEYRASYQERTAFRLSRDVIPWI